MNKPTRAWLDGERRHEQCRFGVFSDEAYEIDLAGRTSPTVVPLCAWKPSEDWPPVVHRRWGGDLEFDRDCAVCPCFKRLTPPPVL